MIPLDQVAGLKKLYPNVLAATEGGTEFCLIEQLKLPEGCEPRVVKGLLCPTPRDGYPSRLFLSKKVIHKGKGQNWNPNQAVVILGQEWWSVSWKPMAGQTLVEMILDHLGAFRV